MSHRYNLEPYKGMNTRYRCPECKKNKVFALYIDNESGEPLNDKTGRCNRESGCGYHYTPKQYFTDNGIEQPKDSYTHVEKPKAPIAYIDREVFTKSLTAYDKNKFVLFLNTLFDEETVQGLIRIYNIGSSGTWPGATTFWYVDSLDRINYGKIMVYDQTTGKRDKVKNNHCANVLEKALKKTKQAMPEWLVKYQQNETKINCLFGEHLLKASPQKPVAIVESEKTAIIASVYLPQFLWLACGSLGNLSQNRCKALAGRSVTLYPDLNAFDKWMDKGSYLKFKVSSILETNCTPEEKQAGLDVADYLVKVNVKGVKESLPIKTTDKGFSTIIQDKEISAKSTEEDFKTVTTRGEIITTPQPDDKQLNQSPIPADVVRLQQFYSNLEDNGLIPDEHRNYIGSLFQGVMIYLKDPLQLMLYTEPLEKLRTEIESLNKQQIAI